MDHFHIPPTCLPQALSVPYLNLAPLYDGNGFGSFAARHAQDPEALLSARNPDQDRAAWVESFFQEWFFFGLLHEFAAACGVGWSASDFKNMDEAGQGEVVTTRKLLEVYARRAILRQLQLVALRVGRDPDEFVRMPYDATVDTTAQTSERWMRKSPENEWNSGEADRRAEEFIREACVRDISGGSYDAGDVPLGVLRLRLVVCRALTITGVVTNQEMFPTKARAKLGEYVATARRLTIRTLYQQDPVIRPAIALSILLLCHSLSRIIWVVFGEQMIDNVNSSKIMEHLENVMLSRGWCPSRARTLPLLGDLTLAYVASLLPPPDTLQHRSCTARKCFSRPSTLNAMASRHHESCNGTCAPFLIDKEQLIHMWRSGGIPGATRSVRNSEGQKSFELVDCTHRRYVAISHVWSHGLGNPHKNELPSCQIDFLAHLVRAVAGNEAALWIDTLSVPIEKDCKLLAISKLRSVYSGAACVLVVDRDLLEVGSDKTEQMLQLICSEWQRRLWTLQEGRLAHELRIQFKDRAVPVTEYVPESASWDQTITTNQVFDNTSTLTYMIQKRFTENKSKGSHFLALVEDMAQRSVTVKSDEPVCLATLLGLSLRESSSYPTVVDIYKSLPSIPEDIIFLNQPRLSVSGFSWAPATFLEADNVWFPSSETTSSGRLTTYGLYVNKDCHLIGRDIDYTRNFDQLPGVYVVEDFVGRSFAIRPLEIVSPDGLTVTSRASGLITNPAILWMKESSCFDTTSAAVLVSVTHTKDGCRYCDFVMGMHGWRIEERTTDFHYQMLRGSAGILDTVYAEFLQCERFCIS